jgi:hypothetical protein
VDRVAAQGIRRRLAECRPVLAGEPARVGAEQPYSGDATEVGVPLVEFSRTVLLLRETSWPPLLAPMPLMLPITVEPDSTIVDLGPSEMTPKPAVAFCDEVECSTIMMMAGPLALPVATMPFEWLPTETLSRTVMLITPPDANVPSALSAEEVVARLDMVQGDPGDAIGDLGLDPDAAARRGAAVILEHRVRHEELQCGVGEGECNNSPAAAGDDEIADHAFLDMESRAGFHYDAVNNPASGAIDIEPAQHDDVACARTNDNLPGDAPLHALAIDRNRFADVQDAAAEVALIDAIDLTAGIGLPERCIEGGARRGARASAAAAEARDPGSRILRLCGCDRQRDERGENKRK